MKKWLSMFLAAVMLCGVLAGCGGTQSGSTPASGAQSASAAGDSNVNAEGFPIVNEPITLRGMVALNANVKDWNEHPALKRMEELTGIHIEWECVPDAGFTEKRNLAFASDDLPDIILRAKISPQEEMKYAANGQLVALDEYLDYAPNLSALIEQDDAIRKGIVVAEIQQNSNVTYRIYDYGRLGADGKPRQLHIPQALDVTLREPPKAQDFHGHLAQCDYFTVDAVEGDFEDVCDETSFTSLLVLEGRGTLTETATGESLPIRKGQSLFLPAGTGAYAVTGTDLKCLRTRV